MCRELLVAMLLALNRQGLLLLRGAWQACTMTGVPLCLLHHMQGHHRVVLWQGKVAELQFNSVKPTKLVEAAPADVQLTHGTPLPPTDDLTV